MASTRRTAPTSQDVAREAGVAQSTVSYVLTGRRSISAQTRQRVLDAMARLSYQPNAGARALAGQRMQVLGAVFPFRAGQDLAVAMELVGALAAAARRHDHDILLASADEGPEGLARLQGTGICDGVFIFEVVENDPRLDRIRGEGAIPAVVIGLPRDTDGLVCVDLDFSAAGGLAVDELADLGHRTALLVTGASADGPGHLTYKHRFVHGAQRRAEDRELRLVHVPVSGPCEDAVTALRTAIADHQPTAVAMMHDMSSVMSALERAGLSPGGDTAVVTIGRDVDAERQNVRLTSITLEPEAVANRAVELLLGHLDTGEAVPGVHLIAPRLIRRESSRPA